MDPKASQPKSDLAAMASLTKSRLENLITERSNRITFLRKEDGYKRSAVWEQFNVVCVDGRPQEYIQCTKCSSLISWISGSTSTATRHMSSCRGSQGSQQMTIDQFQTKIVPASAIKALNDAITIGLAKDLKPLGMVKGQGFQHIAQQLINFGAKYHFQDAKKVINHPSTLKRKLPVLVQKEKEKIKSMIKTAPSYPTFAFTTDMWTDKYHQRHFLSLCVHYVNDCYKLNTHMLAMDEFPEIDKTTANIRTEIQRMIEAFFVDDATKIFDMATGVTDGGSNFVNIFPNRIPCMCHKLNLVMHWMFNDTKPRETLTEVPAKKQFVLTGACPEKKNTLTALKSLVRYFKKTGLNHRLTDTLKQENDTRWNGKLTMLESYLKANTEVKKIILEKNELGKLVNISDSAVAALVPFLKPFEDCTKAWSNEKVPTIHEVVLRIVKLRSQFDLQPSDSAEMKRLKQQGLICFNEYMDVGDIYYAACMLDPRYKRLKFVDDDTRRRAISFLRSKMENLFVAPMIDMDESGEPIPKKGKFDDYQDSSDEEDEIEKDEIEKYLESKAPPKGEEFDVLNYWKNSTGLPKLKTVALEILAIPASQTSDERVFSSTGATLTPRRTDLKGSTLSDLTFIHKNYVI